MKVNKMKLIAFFISVLAMEVSYAEGEVLYGVTITPDGLEFQVASAGCTEKKDFFISVTKSNANTPIYNVTLNRTKSDNCEKLVPGGVSIKYTRKELGLDRFAELILTNKIGNTSQRKSMLEKSSGNKEYFTKQPISTLINKSLRVLEENGFYTGDYNPNRVNIEIDKWGKIINIHEG